MMIMGSGFAAAAVGAFTSLPATVINAVFMVIAFITMQFVKHGDSREGIKQGIDAFDFED